MRNNSLFVQLSGAILLAAVAVVIVKTARAADNPQQQRATEVSGDNFTFGPESITVAANSTVTWVNHDDAHNRQYGRPIPIEGAGQ